MNCPYCQSEVHPDAVVCKTCHRDFYLVKPMMEKIAALEKQLAEVPDISVQLARIALLEQQLAESKSTAPPPAAPGGEAPFADVLAYLVLPLLLLLAAHALITVVFDLNVLYLRVVSIVLPMPFGFLLFRKHARRMLPWFLGVVVLALASVIGMSGITSLVDGTPVMPQNNFEWREVIEYSASIAFSFLTGMLLGTVALVSGDGPQSTQPKGPVVRLLSFAIDDGKVSPEKLHAHLKKLQEYGGTIVALCTTVFSIYTGLKHFL
ncbi:MAG: hypothetical protein WCP99_00645 [Burkholderiales bacterium]